MRDTRDPFGQAEVASRTMAGATLMMVFRYACISFILFFWVGPIFLPWLLQTITILKG